MSIGATLAAAREEAGLTVARVSEMTCIRETIVIGIENDDFDLCGGHFYARGHIRSIATHIGIDPEPLVQQYDEEHGGSPRAAPPPQASDAKPAIAAAPRSWRSPNWSVALVAMLVVVVVYGVYTLVSGVGGSQERPSQEEPGPIVRATTSAPNDASSAAPPRGSAPEQQAGQQAGQQAEQRANPPAQQRKRAAIDIRARARSWISVSDSEGEELYSGILHEGEAKRFTDGELIRVVIGNSGGVSLTVNGRDLGVVGDSGQVVTARVYPDRVEGLS